MARASVTICDMSFTSTGNALVVIDSLGQLYVYRMSPISDPGQSTGFFGCPFQIVGCPFQIVDPILRLLSLELQRWRCSRVERF
jgi:hypothetical protein